MAIIKAIVKKVMASAVLFMAGIPGIDPHSQLCEELMGFTLARGDSKPLAEASMSTTCAPAAKRRLTFRRFSIKGISRPSLCSDNNARFVQASSMDKTKFRHKLSHHLEGVMITCAFISLWAELGRIILSAWIDWSKNSARTQHNKVLKSSCWVLLRAPGAPIAF